TSLSKCRLHILKVECVKDYLLKEEFIANQERLRPLEEKNEEDRSKFDDLRESPMSARNLEELIDENHAIVSSSVGTEYYVRILSFVDKDQLELEFAILMHNKVSFIGLMILVWWNGMKRLCYLFARKFYLTLFTTDRLFSNYTLI
ncbi:unnamed protein product, partial [Musa acuminata subsp. burmannicoides]